MECCRIDIEEYEYDYKLIIAKFKERIDSSAKYQDVLKSTSFATGVHNRITWRLEVPLYATRSSNGDSIQFNLMFIRSGNPNIICRNIIYFLDVHGNRCEVVSKNFAKVPVPTTQNGIAACSSYYYKKDIIDNSQLYLPNDELTIICKIFVKAEIVINPLLELKPCGKQDLLSSFAKLYNDQEYSDIVIQVANKKYFAHKLLLIARSDVFAAMLRHNMEEAENNVIKINDISPEIFEEILQYIYTNSVENLDEIALDLLPVADKYQLKGLMELCENSLCKSLKIENAAEIYILADRHHAKKLIEHTKYFINTYIGDIMKTPGYKFMEKEHPQSAILIYKAFVSKIRNEP